MGRSKFSQTWKDDSFQMQSSEKQRDFTSHILDLLSCVVHFTQFIGFMEIWDGETRLASRSQVSMRTCHFSDRFSPKKIISFRHTVIMFKNETTLRDISGIWFPVPGMLCELSEFASATRRNVDSGVWRIMANLKIPVHICHDIQFMHFLNFCLGNDSVLVAPMGTGRELNPWNRKKISMVGVSGLHVR